MSKRSPVGLVYNQRIPGAEDLATRLIERLGLGKDGWACSLLDLVQLGEERLGVALLITVGGDGTILQVAQLASPRGIPILGINMGRVGFMTELRAQEALEKVPAYLEEDIRVEKRAMLRAGVKRRPTAKGSGKRGKRLGGYHALNEVVVGSGAVSRMITVEATVDGAPLTVYRADSVIVATATGSTGYALSAGGSILHPLSRDMLLKPVAPYLGLGSALVLPSTSRVQLALMSNRPAVLSADGFVDVKLEEGDLVEVEASPYFARFLRAHPPSYYYATLTQRLGLEPGDARSGPAT